MKYLVTMELMGSVPVASPQEMVQWLGPSPVLPAIYKLGGRYLARLQLEG